jgi:hypothetical protein
LVCGSGMNHKKRAPQGRKSLAQHGAAGGILGKAGINPSPVGTTDILTQAR